MALFDHSHCSSRALGSHRVRFTGAGRRMPCRPGGHQPFAAAPISPKDVTDTLIGSVDLGPEIAVPDRHLRTRRLVVQPGGVVPIHSHIDRPALIYTVRGTIVEYRSNSAVSITHKAGEIPREAEGISHYWINKGKTPVIFLSSDVHHGK